VSDCLLIFIIVTVSYLNFIVFDSGGAVCVKPTWIVCLLFDYPHMLLSITCSTRYQNKNDIKF